MTTLQEYADHAFENYKGLKQRVTEQRRGDCVPMLEWHTPERLTVVSMAIDGSLPTIVYELGMSLIEREGTCDRIVLLSEGYHIKLPPGEMLPEPHIYLGDLFKMGDPRVMEDISMMAVDRELKIYARSVDFVVTGNVVVFDLGDDVMRNTSGPIYEALLEVMKTSIQVEAQRS